MLNRLLTLMADGRFHSGEHLGELLGVSRAAVWKVLRRLESQGFPIQRVRGKGYRIPSGAVMLSADSIRAVLTDECAQHWEWHLFDEIDSTNAEAQRQIVAAGPRALLCASEQQAAGRGRRGREWASPYAQNIYLTLAEPFDSGAQSLEGLSLLVGLALVESLEDAGFRGCQLKWPNDVLLDGRKLAGILIEIAGDLTSDCVAIIGVGVNVLMREPPTEVSQPWTSLLLSGQQGVLDRNLLIAGFLRRLLLALEHFRSEGFAPFVEAWSLRDAWRNRPVRVTAGVGVTDGINLGVSERGALRLMTASGEVLVSGGEVSLRLTDAS